MKKIPEADSTDSTGPTLGNNSVMEPCGTNSVNIGILPVVVVYNYAIYDVTNKTKVSLVQS